MIRERSKWLSKCFPFIAFVTILLASAAPAQVVSDLPGRTSGEVKRGARARLPARKALIQGIAGLVQRSRVIDIKGSKLNAEATEDSMFLPASAYDTSGDLISLTVADVNGDGTPDVIVTSLNSTPIGVLLGMGDGTFGPEHIYQVGTKYPTSIAVADVNGDNKADILVATADRSYEYIEGQVAVLLGNGDGTFMQATTYGSGGRGANSIAATDVNRDGRNDVVVATEDNITVLPGNGDGTLGAARVVDPCCYYNASIAVADLNKDGMQDLVVAAAAYGFDGLRVLLGNGNGTFQPDVSYKPGGIGPNFVTVADVNDDGILDVLVVNLGISSDNYNEGSIGVLLGKGDGTMRPALAYASGGLDPFSVAVADVSRDSNTDVLVSNACVVHGGCTGIGDLGVVGVLLNNGNGTFQPAMMYSSGGYGAVSVASEDINGDSRPDVLIANNNVECDGEICGSHGSVGVLLNKYSPHTATVTTLASTLNPSIFGRSVTFTARVSSSSGVPSGSVAFFDGPTLLANVPLLNRSASFSSSTFTAGSHSIVAAYRGSLEHHPSGSPVVMQIVKPASTATALSVVPNPSLVPQPVTHTAAVTTESGAVLPGSVIFRDNGTVIATVTLVNNQAVYNTKSKPIGTHAITASYSGSADFAVSTSSTVMEYVQGYTNTVLTTSRSPSFVGQPVTFTATVTSRFGSIPDGELVTFGIWASVWGTATLINGKASFTTVLPSARSYSVKATYAGDAKFRPSAGIVTQAVQKYQTTTARWSSLNPSTERQAVTFTARVTSSGPTVPTGRVIFKDGTTRIGSAILSGGLAKLTRATLGPGTHEITAYYLGDSACAVSTSSVLNQVVK